MDTALLAAIREKSRDAFVSALEAYSGDISSQTNDTRYANWFSGLGFTVLQLTSFLRPEWAPLLLERGAKLDLYSACALGDIATIKQILAEDPDAVNHEIDTYSPSQFAIRHPEALRAMFEAGDDPNRPLEKLAWFDWEDSAAEQGLSDRRLIHMLAVGRGKKPMGDAAEVLKDFGADLNALSSPFGEAAIHLSAMYDRAELIRWYVENGVPVDMRTVEEPPSIARDGLFETGPFELFNSHGKTPLMIALGEGQSNAVAVLLEIGADPNAKDSAGLTPMHYAAGAFWQENVALVENLIKHGARADVVDNQGRRPVDFAATKGYETTKRLLGASA